MDTTIKTERDKGFTLIELLIVIVILGILATVTVFAVQGITSRGESSACAADKKTLEVAVEAYYASNGTYPTAMSQLTSGAYQFLRSTPTLYELGTDGAVNAVSGSNCT